MLISRKNKEILSKILIFFANFLLTKSLRHKYRTKIKKTLLAPNKNELTLWNGVMNNNETLRYILDNKCSIARYGDGESGYMLYDHFKHFFQPYNKELREKLKYILNNPINSCLIGVPTWLNNEALGEFQVNFQCNYWYGWAEYKKQNTTYGSANCFFGMNFDNENQELIKQIWNNRDIVIVTGKGSTFVWIDELFGNSKSHNFIYTKSVDAFSEYNKIIEKITQYPKNSLILIALGITATALAYDLSKLGYQAIDIGHISNHYLTEIKGIKHIDDLRNEGKYIDGVTDINQLIKEQF